MCNAHTPQCAGCLGLQLAQRQPQPASFFFRFCFAFIHALFFVFFILGLVSVWRGGAHHLWFGPSLVRYCRFLFIKCLHSIAHDFKIARDSGLIFFDGPSCSLGSFGRSDGC
jgi:hypothetical protein